MEREHKESSKKNWVKDNAMWVAGEKIISSGEDGKLEMHKKNGMTRRRKKPNIK